MILLNLYLNQLCADLGKRFIQVGSHLVRQPIYTFLGSIRAENPRNIPMKQSTRIPNGFWGEVRKTGLLIGMSRGELRGLRPVAEGCNQGYCTSLEN